MENVHSPSLDSVEAGAPEAEIKVRPWYHPLMGDKKSDDQYTEEETIARREAMLKRLLSTPPKHRAAKGNELRPPKKRGRPKEDTRE